MRKRLLAYRVTVLACVLAAGCSSSRTVLLDSGAPDGEVGTDASTATDARLPGRCAALNHLAGGSVLLSPSSRDGASIAPDLARVALVKWADMAPFHRLQLAPVAQGAPKMIQDVSDELEVEVFSAEWIDERRLLASTDWVHPNRVNDPFDLLVIDLPADGGSQAWASRRAGEDLCAAAIAPDKAWAAVLQDCDDDRPQLGTLARAYLASDQAAEPLDDRVAAWPISVSPDGQQIAFHVVDPSTRSSHCSELWLAGATGAGARLVSTEAGLSHAFAGPGRLLYQACAPDVPDGIGDLMIVEVPGHAPRLLAKQARAVDPIDEARFLMLFLPRSSGLSWPPPGYALSPDGAVVLASRSTEQGEGRVLLAVRLDGGGVIELADDFADGFSGASARFTSDGTQVVYVARADGQESMAAVAADGRSAPRQLGQPLPVPEPVSGPVESPPVCWTFDVGPAGSSAVAYVTVEPDALRWRYWIADLATAEARQVADFTCEDLRVVVPRFTAEQAVLYQPVFKEGPIYLLRPGDDQATVLAEGELLDPTDPTVGGPGPCAVVYNAPGPTWGAHLLPLPLD